MAPRGHPQIEVTFDIDANGIMNVQAIDKSTGKKQQITIKSSGGLSDSDIERMVQEAEAAKETDKLRRELVEIKNESDSMVYQSEKQLQEHGSKIPDSVKDQVRNDISKLNEALTTDDVEKIRECLESLKNSSMEIGKAIYSQSSDESSNNQEQQSEEQ